MDTMNVAHQAPRQTWQQMADEHVALEALELLDRVSDLEAERGTYRQLAVAGLEAVAQLTRRNRQLASRIDHLNTQLRNLMAAPCLACRRAGRSERAA